MSTKSGELHLRDAELLGLEQDGMIAFGSNCRGAEIGEFNQFIIANSSSPLEYPFTGLASQRRVWLGSNGPTGIHHFFFGITDRGDIGELGMCPSMTGTRNCQPAAVWLVHDGDIGTDPLDGTGNGDPDNDGDSNGDSDNDGDGGGNSNIGNGGSGSLSLLCLLLGMSSLRQRPPLRVRRYPGAGLRIILGSCAP